MKFQIYIIQLLLVVMSLCRMSAFCQYAHMGIWTLLQSFCIFLCLIFFVLNRNKEDKTVFIIYTISLLFGAWAHLNNRDIENPFNESFLFIAPVLALYLFERCENYRLIVVFVFILFFIETVICIWERINLTYFIQYNLDHMATKTSISDLTNSEFRSRGLYNHPLFNANVISIILSFILCSPIRKKLKILLVLIGLFALWGCNSRGALAIWIIILIYRLFLYNKKPLQIIVLILFLYFVWPFLLEIVTNLSGLGRLSDNFSDDSTVTRLMAFGVFESYNWDFNSIFIGGNIITYPGTDIGLENGILLDLGYWGWVIGTIKIALEFLITYKVLVNYSIQEKIILMLAFWGVANCNNNIHYPLFLIMWVTVFFAFNSFKSLSFTNKFHR